MKHIYAAKAKDDLVRKNSTSGGMFSALAGFVLAHGGVVYGAAFDENAVLRHVGIDSLEDLPLIRGTKYVKSNTSNAFREILENLKQKRLVLFCGTPCQNAALRKRIGNSLDSSYEKYLILVDFICMGLPSITVFNEYKRWLQKKKRKRLQSMLCRDKISGWKQSSVRLTYQDGTEEISTLFENEYLSPFLKEYGLSNACYKCQYRGYDRSSDVTLADFWGIQDIDPEMDDNLGVSLVFINSLKGKELFDSIKDDIIHKEVKDDRYLKYNPYYIRSPEKREPNQYFYDHLGTMDYGKLIERCSLIVRIRNKKDRVIKKIFK